MLSNWTSFIFQGLMLVLTSVITYLLTRKKNTAETRKVQADAEGQELTNVNTIIKFWKTMVEDLSKEMTDLKNELTTFITHDKEMKLKITGYEKQLADYEKKCNDLERKLEQIMKDRSTPQ